MIGRTFVLSTLAYVADVILGVIARESFRLSRVVRRMERHLWNLSGWADGTRITLYWRGRCVSCERAFGRDTRPVYLYGSSFCPRCAQEELDITWDDELSHEAWSR